LGASGTGSLLLGHIALLAVLHLAGIVLDLDGRLEEVVPQVNRRGGCIQDLLWIGIGSCFGGGDGKRLGYQRDNTNGAGQLHFSLLPALSKLSALKKPFQK